MRVFAAIATAALAVVALASPAAASPKEDSVTACGFHTRNISALYNHCAPDGTHVEIVVQRKTGETVQCVGPGETYLGTIFQVKNAWYNGNLC